MAALLDLKIAKASRSANITFDDGTVSKVKNDLSANKLLLQDAEQSGRLNDLKENSTGAYLYASPIDSFITITEVLGASGKQYLYVVADIPEDVVSKLANKLESNPVPCQLYVATEKMKIPVLAPNQVTVDVTGISKALEVAFITADEASVDNPALLNRLDEDSENKLTFDGALVDTDTDTLPSNVDLLEKFKVDKDTNGLTWDGQEIGGRDKDAIHVEGGVMTGPLGFGSVFEIGHSEDSTTHKQYLEFRIKGSD